MTGLATSVWVLIVLVYFFLATLLPIDKLIGKLYPVFGICLIIMALGVGGGTVINAIQNPAAHPMMELTLQNLNPSKEIWPFMFITVACGATSGFHATQSPMVARTLTSEKQGRWVFYGAMVAEGIIALIWAAAGIAFFYNPDASIGSATVNLAAAGGNSTTVMAISKGLLGTAGGILAVLGVVVCPITSGDTAFRSARLTIADAFHIDQKPMGKRLALSIPLLVVGYLISFVDYSVIWRYFSWSNQTLAMIALWAAAAYLVHIGNKNFWIAAIPAMFMSAVTSTYFFMAPEMYINLSSSYAYPIGIILAVVFFAIFWFRCVLPAGKNTVSAS
jgi:carbon starvation protein CstA